MNYVVANDRDETKVLCYDCLRNQEENEETYYNIVIETVVALPCEHCEEHL